MATGQSHEEFIILDDSIELISDKEEMRRLQEIPDVLTPEEFDKLPGIWLILRFKRGNSNKDGEETEIDEFLDMNDEGLQWVSEWKVEDELGDNKRWNNEDVSLSEEEQSGLSEEGKKDLIDRKKQEVWKAKNSMVWEDMQKKLWQTRKNKLKAMFLQGNTKGILYKQKSKDRIQRLTYISQGSSQTFIVPLLTLKGNDKVVIASGKPLRQYQGKDHAILIHWREVVGDVAIKLARAKGIIDGKSFEQIDMRDRMDEEHEKIRNELVKVKQIIATLLSKHFSQEEEE
jgi:hypothetical protein